MKEWAAQQAEVKAKAATRRVTKTAAKAAKAAIAKGPAAPKIARGGTK